MAEPSTGGPRSSMVYATDECRGCLMATATLVQLGVLKRDVPALKTAFERQGHGIWDLRFKSKHGYRSFAKGGQLWDSGYTSGDWNESDSTPQSYVPETLFGLWLDVVQPWYEG